jgi:methionyl aminopeptidase
MGVIIKTKEEIQAMAESGKILAKILKEVATQVKPGVTTDYLNKVAERLVFLYKAKPSFKGYEGFPTALCSSVNEEIVHAVPSGRKLKQGDIISLDMGVLYKGFHSDMAVTLPVGEASPEALRLIKTTKKALKRGIKKSRPGNTLGDLGNTIQRFIEGQGFGVVRDLCGHGIGRKLHEDPQILNFGKRGKGMELKEGMVICIEPMVTAGDYSIEESGDGYGYKTRDGSLSAHFEHTLAITQKGARVLTVAD